MKPLNKKERNKAFFKVVGLFLISFIIALILGFTTMNYGTVSEQQTKNELEKLKAHLKFQEEIFAPNVGETTNLLSKIPTYKEDGENIEVLNQDIGAILSQTKNQAVEDESWESVMYKDVINALSDLQLAYNEQMKLREQMGDSDEMGEQLQQCITEKNQLQNQVNMLQASGGGGGGADTEELQKELNDTQQKLRQCNLENRALKQEIEKIRNR
ncbi:MAG: type VI secretion system TssO [Tangfeifania sp.]